MDPHDPHARRLEDGWSLIEVVVVLVIVAVLIALGMAGISSSRSSGQLLSATSAANAYANALDGFARDHRGRYPANVGSADWSTPASKGPVSGLLGSTTPYLKTVPESVQDGSITFGTLASGPSITYTQLGGGTGYELVVTVPKRPTCSIRGGDTTSSTLPECSRR